MFNSHVTDPDSVEWVEHPTFAGLYFKPIETRDTHPTSRVSIVRVEVGGEISAHIHEAETETAYVISGEGVIFFGDDEFPFSAGMVTTVVPGTRHGVRNTGDIPMEVFAMHTPPVQ
jgi:mannose-6-phosphate isomerase-like protein (cupin superfamily)